MSDIYNTKEAHMFRACALGDVEKMKSFVSNGLIVDTEFLGESYLLAACRRGHHEMVAYLIQSGANVNHMDGHGRTALHGCVIYGQFECMKLLVGNGAQLDIMYQDMTILQLASERGHVAIIEYLMDILSSSRAVKIEALELLGAACVDRLDDHASAHKHWLRSLEERDRAEPCDQVQPKSEHAHAAYGNIIEFQTVEDLNRIASSSDDMWMQALIVWERILGPHSYDVSRNITARASAYYKAGNFDRCLSLRKYDLELQLKAHGPNDHERARRSIGSLVELFADGTHDGFPVKCEDVLDALSTILHLLKLELSLYHQNYTHRVYVLPNYFPPVLIIIDLIKLRPAMSEKYQMRFKNLLTNIVKLDLSDCKIPTLLHLACYNRPHMWSSLEVVKLLLEAGADPQTFDYLRNTPLHKVSKYFRPSKTEIIKLLLSHGAHYDARDVHGECFIEYLPSEILSELGHPFDYCTLQCLSANVIVDYYIPYQDVLPPKVAKFVFLHSPKRRMTNQRPTNAFCVAHHGNQAQA